MVRNRPSQALALAAPLLALATVLAGCSSGPHATEIGMVDDLFVGGNQTVPVGTTVKFDNEGSNLHQVSIHKVGEPPAPLRLDADVRGGQSAEYTFSEAGTYHVWCKYHGGMTIGMAMVLTVA